MEGVFQTQDTLKLTTNLNSHLPLVVQSEIKMIFIEITGLNGV